MRRRVRFESLKGSIQEKGLAESVLQRIRKGDEGKNVDFVGIK